ncbi:hypothetical protein N656DRAFT_848824 [Canariomyces notabilis]|uniref:Uncharacterized protein n=1 Tax=Canariomyces notabilis TaxID=2074819 RepID=A0AAN6QG68_9PEZI|nr:hypothetical protein N656DRAFT_848824 [Canariomyces arenarius]
MGKGKMDEAAAERIRKARGEKDGFARRASMAARQNKQGGESPSGKKGDSGGGWGSKQQGGNKGSK